MNRHITHTFATVVVAATFGVLTAVFATGCASDSKPVDAPPAQPSKSSSMSRSSSMSGTSAMSGSSSMPGPRQPGAPAPQPVSPAAAGLETYRGGLVASQEQIDKTLASLAELTDPSQTDLSGAYNRYCDNLARMVEHSDTMKREADMMRASRDDYFGKWEEKVTEIDNPTIRQSAEARRKRLRDAHERIISTSGAARDAYEPFMKDLQDIKKFLSSDLSKGAIADLSDAAKKVQSDGAVVKQKIGAVVATLDSVQAR
jgi:hypothetical protein